MCRSLEVTDDIGRFTNRLEKVEQAAEFAVKSNKAATLAWLARGTRGTKVYFGYSDETAKIVYVGITRQALPARQVQHFDKGKTFTIRELSNLPDNLTTNQARAIEQWYIDRKKMEKLGGVLENFYNSIRPEREIAVGAEQFADAFVKNFGLPQP